MVIWYDSRTKLRKNQELSPLINHLVELLQTPGSLLCSIGDRPQLLAQHMKLTGMDVCLIPGCFPPIVRNTEVNEQAAGKSK